MGSASRSASGADAREGAQEPAEGAKPFGAPDGASEASEGALAPLPFDGADVVRLAVEQLKHCPAPVTLLVAVGGLLRPVWWTSSRARYGRAPAEQRAAFSPFELEHIAGAFARDRLPAGGMQAWSVRKLREPTFRVSLPLACAGMVPPLEPWRSTWVSGSEHVGGHWAHHGPTIGQLLRHFDARLVAVEFDARETA